MLLFVEAVRGLIGVLIGVSSTEDAKDFHLIIEGAIDRTMNLGDAVKKLHSKVSYSSGIFVLKKPCLAKVFL